MAKVAVLGYGTVGSGVVEILLEHQAILNKRTGKQIELGYILETKTPPDVDYKDKFTSNYDEILADPEVAVVAEAIGGIKPVFDFLSRALKAGKHVVTANKELVAEKGAQLLALAQENKVKFLFEASVGGGIPIIRPIRESLIADEILSLAGILNGTSNFILTKMRTENVSFNDALKKAQALGYAEADPSADVDGPDTCRKICILASLAFGEHVYPKYVHTEGIRTVEPEQIGIAEKAGYSIKLIGKAAMVDDQLQMIVAPMMINKEELLGNVEGVFNGLEVISDMVGEIVHYGPGAGKLPTGSAMISDIAEAIGRPETPGISWRDSSENNVVNYLLNKTSQMIRYNGTLETVEHLFGEIIDVSHPEFKGEVAFLTPYYLTEIQVNEKLRLLELEGGKVISTIRVLGDTQRWGI